MKDIQSQLDNRRINIQKVGVKTISYPITVRDKSKSEQNTIATLNMYVNLPHKFKGTHMSRFIEVLNLYHGKIDIRNFHRILEKIKERLEAEASHLEVEFPYFLSTQQHSGGLMVRHYTCTLIGSLYEQVDVQLKVSVPISLPVLQKIDSLLPRLNGLWGKAEVTVRFSRFMWIEDLLLHIENSIEMELQSFAQSKNTSLPVEPVALQIGNGLNRLDVVRTYSVCVENLGADYSTFATLDSTYGNSLGGFA